MGGDAVELEHWDAGERALAEGCFLFRGVEPSVREECFRDSRCVRRTAQRGEVIYTPSAFERSLGVVLSGRVQVTKETLLVSVLEPGALFGAAALFQEREDYATTLTARTPCALLLLPQSLVEELLERSPQAAGNYIRYLSGRIRFLSDRLDGLLAGSAERRLALYLLEREEDGRVLLGEPAAALAQRLHVSRASLYRAFDALMESGAVEKRGKEVHILDREGLNLV